MPRGGYGDAAAREHRSDSYHVKLYRMRLYKEPPRTWDEPRDVEDDSVGPDSFRLRRDHRRWW